MEEAIRTSRALQEAESLVTVKVPTTVAALPSAGLEQAMRPDYRPECKVPAPARPVFHQGMCRIAVEPLSIPEASLHDQARTQLQQCANKVLRHYCVTRGLDARGSKQALATRLALHLSALGEPVEPLCSLGSRPMEFDHCDTRS